MLNVVITLPSFDPRFWGPRERALRFQRELEDLGVEVKVVACGSHARAIGLPTLTAFHATPVPRTLGPLREALQDADIVHVLGYRDPVGSAAALLSRGKRPVVLEPAGMLRRRNRSVLLKATFDATVGRAVLQATALIVATSSMEAKEIVEAGVARAKVAVRPSGIEAPQRLAQERVEKIREEYGVPPGAKLVVALSRFSRIKGLPTLVAAIAQLDGVHALIAGPDEGDGTLARLLQDAARYRIEDRIKLVVGGLWGEDKAAVLAAADVFCLPSLYESFGNAAAEAAASGLPVVLTKECGVSEWLDGRSTLVVRSGDVDGMRAALERVLADSDMRQAAIDTAPKLLSYLGWGAVADKQLGLYRRVLVESTH